MITPTRALQALAVAGLLAAQVEGAHRPGFAGREPARE
jgi:hypothetical protein